MVEWRGKSQSQAGIEVAQGRSHYSPSTTQCDGRIDARDHHISNGTGSGRGAPGGKSWRFDPPILSAPQFLLNGNS